MDHHLGRVRTWDKIRGADKIEKVGVSQPPAADNNLFAQHGNVSRRTTEGGEAESREK
jgi:hypothetical protein